MIGHVLRRFRPGLLLLMIAALAAPAPAASPLSPNGDGANCDRTSVGLVPIFDLAMDRYLGFRGGLYPHGRNRMAQAYREIGVTRAERIEPLNTQGDPTADGSVVFLSVGMSNAEQEFSAFMDVAASHPGVDPHVAIVNGAQGGFDAQEIARAGSMYWSNLEEILQEGGFRAEQVQAAWLKEAIESEDRPFPEGARALRDSLREIVRIMRDRFPNLQIVYLSSRTYGGYATTDLSPEPFAYQSGFAVKWLIGKDVRSEPRERPWLAWGPYLWTDGTAGRGDGLVWDCVDVEPDGTHPSATGEQKVSELLLDHLTTRTTATPWFLG